MHNLIIYQLCYLVWYNKKIFSLEIFEPFLIALRNIIISNRVIVSV